MEPRLKEPTGWERVMDLSLVVAELAVAVPCVPLMAAVGLLESVGNAGAVPRPEAPPAPRLDPKLAPGLVRARAMLESERLRHPVLSESFFALTCAAEKLDAELSSARTGSSPS